VGKKIQRSTGEKGGRRVEGKKLKGDKLSPTEKKTKYHTTQKERENGKHNFLRGQRQFT